MKHVYQLIGIAILSAFICGCGETMHGIGNDASRIMHGTKTIFFSDAK